MLVRIEQKPRVIGPFAGLIATLREMSFRGCVRHAHLVGANSNKSIHQG